VKTIALAKKSPAIPFIALLRGINVTGRNQIPMAELRLLCEKLGWTNVQTYIQSGNLVFHADKTPAAPEIQLEQDIQRRFEFSIPVIVRAGADWPSYIAANPFAEASKSEPNAVTLILSKAPPKSDAARLLQERAAHGERVQRVGDVLWIHFAGGIARSKLSPALLDRLIGSTATARNWRTVLKIGEMTNGASQGLALGEI
jgi:uncharacterized protein (DUF1697 family)